MFEIYAIFETLYIISQGSAATSLRYGEICNAHFVANLVLSLARKKSLKIDQYFTKLLT